SEQKNQNYELPIKHWRPMSLSISSQPARPLYLSDWSGSVRPSQTQSNLVKPNPTIPSPSHEAIPTISDYGRPIQVTFLEPVMPIQFSQGSKRFLKVSKGF